MKCRICSRCRTRRSASRLAALGLLLPAVLGAQARSTVPFVGCRSEGQADPIDAPAGKPVTVPIAESSAKKLAYYTDGGSIGILAPRGWHCLGTYGSNGGSVTVSPGPVTRSELVAHGTALAGPMVVRSFLSGSGSGSAIVAEVLARIFPQYRKLARATLRWFDRPIPTGPYPQDRLTHKSQTVVEFDTPAHTEGMGTYTLLKQGNSPILGVVVLLNETPDMLLVSARLPPELNGLSAAIIHQAEHDATQRVQ